MQRSDCPFTLPSQPRDEPGLPFWNIRRTPFDAFVGLSFAIHNTHIFVVAEASFVNEVA